MTSKKLNNTHLISICVPKDEWHTCLNNTIAPLIKTQLKENQLVLNNFQFNVKGGESIKIELLIKGELTEKVLENVNRYISSKYASNDYEIKNIVNEHDGQQQPSKLLVQQMIAITIIDGLCDDIIDNDTIVTFALYTLLACYKTLPDNQRLNVASDVSAYCIKQAEHHYEHIDHIFYQVKYHVSKDSINEIYIDVFDNNDRSLKWLRPIEKAIFNIVEKAKNKKLLVNLFLDITNSIKDQLGLDASIVIMINKFVFNILSEKAVKKSNLLKPSLENVILYSPREVHNNKTVIPLLTYYSPSHELLFKEHFYPSYLKYLNKDFELFVLKDKQACDVVFRQGTWNNQVKEKIIYVNNFIQQATCDFFLFSDVDIIFFKNIKEALLLEMNDSDLLLQSDNANGQTNNLCSGFYFCRVNDKTKSFFNYITTNYDNKQSDQQNLNMFLPQSDLKYKALSNKFYNFSHSTGQIWHSGLKIPFPNFPIIMYHANYTIGNDNKKFLLEVFKEWDNLFFI